LRRSLVFDDRFYSAVSNQTKFQAKHHKYSALLFFRSSNFRRRNPKSKFKPSVGSVTPQFRPSQSCDELIQSPMDPNSRSSIQKLEALILKIGMFSLGYAIPSSIVLACYYYETQYYDKWINSWLITKANSQSDSINFMSSIIPKYCDLEESPLKSNPEKPKLFIFMVKYLIQMLLGIICGLWVWSMKTIHQWFAFCGCKEKIPGAAGNSNLYSNSDFYGSRGRYPYEYQNVNGQNVGNHHQSGMMIIRKG